mmetsp:Transcript_66291/g.168062  ORF Transcript_66291/g.168062 Transcript_66291/m.168062 type:complete len:579 (+) Transcript_66291:74-1810(+)
MQHVPPFGAVTTPIALQVSAASATSRDVEIPAAALRRIGPECRSSAPQSLRAALSIAGLTAVVRRCNPQRNDPARSRARRSLWLRSSPPQHADAQPAREGVQVHAVQSGEADALISEDLPSLDQQILGLALPSLVALCAEPVLSIIDTGFVGRLPDAALSLGGLGVATSVFDFIFRCYNFLCVVTVPLVAQAVVAKRRGDTGAEDPAQITGRIIGLAAAMGLLTWLTLLAVEPLALQYAGADPGTQLADVAQSYLSIRAVALPASLVNTVAIGAFRGQLDTTTPLRIVLLQTVANVMLDAILVFGFDVVGIPALGVQGAALATSLSIWLACGAFCAILTRQGKVAWQAALTWPSALSAMQPLIVGGSSQLLRTLSLQTVLLQFTRTVVGLDVGGLAVAAHQVGIRTWFFALFALDSIAVAAQGLIPTAMAGGGSASAREVANRLMFWGGAGGCLTGALLTVGADSIPAIFTDSAEVQITARPLIMIIAVLQPLAGLVFTWDGIFQGLEDYSYLAVAMAISAVLTIAALQVDALHSSLEGVWLCFSLFLVLRAAGLAWRFWTPAGPLHDDARAGKQADE